MLVEGVLEVGVIRVIWPPEAAFEIGLVVREQELGAGWAIERVAADAGIRGNTGGKERSAAVGDEACAAGGTGAGADLGLGAAGWRPRPGVAEPELHEQVQRSGPVAAIGHFDPHHDIFFIHLRMFDEDVEVAIAIEHVQVEQREVGLLGAALPSHGDDRAIGKLALRVFVLKALVRVRWRIVEVEVELLDVLAVLSFGRGQTEETLFQDRIAAVPERRRHHQELVAIAPAGDRVLAPAVGFAAGFIVR